MDKVVLITSVGGLVGTFLTKHLFASGKYYLIGVDINTNIPLKKMLNKFYQVPKSYEDEYTDYILEIVKKESVDVIIPVSSHDIEIYSKKGFREKLKSHLCIMPFEMHKCLHDKKESYAFLEKNGVCTPDVYAKDIIYPFILKECRGSGSKGIYKIENDVELAYWGKRMKNPVAVEYLEGEEYTVDCLFNQQGKCLGYNNRQRIKVNGGGGVVSKNVNNLKIEKVIRKLELTKSIIGPVNFQYKINTEGSVVVFDFNTRLASGGLPLTVYSGFDIPELLIQIICNPEKVVECWRCPEDKIGLVMHRYYEERYYYEQDSMGRF